MFKHSFVISLRSVGSNPVTGKSYIWIRSYVWLSGRGPVYVNSRILNCNLKILAVLKIPGFTATHTRSNRRIDESSTCPLYGCRWFVGSLIRTCMDVRIRLNPQWVRILVSPVKGALSVRVDSNRRLADGLRGPWFNINIELWNGLVCSPQL